MIKFTGDFKDLEGNGFEYVEEFGSYVRNCEYEYNGKKYTDILCIMLTDNHPEIDSRTVFVDIPHIKVIKNIMLSLVKDLIDKNMVVWED